ncbi:MAG: 1-acyl-sn-glycerol-3-phosphate acyltransferase [Lachnospiraceae bacterium]|nr:1-acyl-sn-glycerol-3-phosphate acyltransferase [Lachnospiraceae bacterium]
MFHTGLGKYRKATVDNFTSDIGIKIRRIFLGKFWRRILKLCTKRKIIIEQYPYLDKNEVYVFCCNHSFDEDIISSLASVDRNVYMLQGTTDQMLHNPVFIALWFNGMIYLDRMNPISRKQAVEKMKRILRSGTSVLLFPEGGYNNTENQLIQPLFSSPWILSKELGCKVVPFISFNDIGTDIIYIRAGEPIDLSLYDKEAALKLLRDKMSTLVYEIMVKHVPMIKRTSLSSKPRKKWMEIRKQVYDCQQWYADVWEEELTYYPGHGVTTPKQMRKFVDKVNVHSENAHIIADMLVRREEDKRYDLIEYLRENMNYAK